MRKKLFAVGITFLILLFLLFAILVGQKNQPPSVASRFLTTFFTLDGADPAMQALIAESITPENSDAMIETLYSPLAAFTTQEYLAMWAVDVGQDISPVIERLEAADISTGQTLDFTLTLSTGDSLTGPLQTNQAGLVTYLRISHHSLIPS